MLSAPLGELLRQCAIERDHPSAKVRDLSQRLSPEAVIAAATHHRIVGCVRDAMQKAGLEIPPELDARYRQALAWHVLAMHESRLLGDALDSAGLPWLIFKGPVLTETVYRRPGLRSYVDIDVLVRPRDLGKAIVQLEASGFASIDDDWARFRQMMLGEVHLRSPHGVPIDLHWTLLNTHRARAQFDLRTSAMFEQATSVLLAGRPTPTFDPADTLMHLALHACSSGGDLLVWLKDIEQALRRGVDWDVVVRRAKARRIGPQVALMLLRTSRVLEAPIPGEVVHALEPSMSWRLVGAAADRLSPAHRTTGAGCPARIVARATRTGTVSSLAELSRRSGNWMATALRHQGRVGPASLVPPQVSASEALEQREQFVAAVAAQD